MLRTIVADREVAVRHLLRLARFGTRGAFADCDDRSLHAMVWASASGQLVVGSVPEGRMLDTPAVPVVCVRRGGSDGPGVEPAHVVAGDLGAGARHRGPRLVVSAVAVLPGRPDMASSHRRQWHARGGGDQTGRDLGSASPWRGHRVHCPTVSVLRGGRAAAAGAAAAVERSAAAAAVAAAFWGTEVQRGVTSGHRRPWHVRWGCGGPRGLTSGLVVRGAYPAAGVGATSAAVWGSGLALREGGRGRPGPLRDWVACWPGSS